MAENDENDECCPEGEQIGPHQPFACRTDQPCPKCEHIMREHWRAYDRDSTAT